MNIYQRKEVYLKALKDYKRANSWWKFLFSYKDTDNGFCAYFLYTHNIEIYTNFRQTLSELYSQHPAKYNLYWFNPGELQPRIECLERAIKLTKETIRDMEFNEKTKI